MTCTRLKFSFRRSVAAAFSLIALAVCQHVWSQPEPSPALEEAQGRFRQGLQLYAEDDFRAALVEFQRAYELAPSYRILFNIAQVQFELRDYPAALRSFERYLADGGARIADSRRKSVESDIEQLRARIAHLFITANKEGAEVFIDDVLVGTTPLTTNIAVSAGRRKITARLTDYLPTTRVVDVAGGDSLPVHLPLVRPEPDAPAVAVARSKPLAKPLAAEPIKADAAEPSPAATETPPKTYAHALEPQANTALFGWAITGVLASGATVTGILALRASSDLQDQRRTPNVGRGVLDDASSKARRYALITDVLGAGALVAGGISLYLTLEPDEQQAPVVEVHPGVGTISVSGTF